MIRLVYLVMIVKFSMILSRIKEKMTREGRGLILNKRVMKLQLMIMISVMASLVHREM